MHAVNIIYDSVYEEDRTFKVVPDFSPETFQNADSIVDGGRAIIYYNNPQIFSLAGGTIFTVTDPVSIVIPKLLICRVQRRTFLYGCIRRFLL